MGMLSKRIRRRGTERRWVDICEGFKVEVCWPSQEVRNEVSRALRFGIEEAKKGQSQRVVLESDLASRKLYAREVITGWEGLTPELLVGYLRVPMDPRDYDELKAEVAKQVNGSGAGDGTIPFDPDNAESVYCYALNERFAAKVQQAVADWDEEVRADDAAVGKASATSSDL